MPLYWTLCGIVIAIGSAIFLYGTRDETKSKRYRPLHRTPIYARPNRFNGLLQGAFSLLAITALVIMAGSGIRISTANTASSVVTYGTLSY
jgi:hypothetical protein